jgi:ornithine cyclodeaminase/alanine dehydrogenase-like protein (mu-crystallin family)
MNRRDFIYTGAGLALAGQSFAQQRKRRVGMIGCGWYGKTDLFRLIQVEPVEVVSLCDVDSKMLSDAAEMVSSPQE